MAPEVVPAVENRTIGSIRSSTRHFSALGFLRLLSVAAMLFHCALALRPDDMLVSRPLLEDSFYALSVSRSIGHGLGFTVDGVNPTNGVQPLVCLVYAPLFTIAGNDTPLALRLVLVVQVALYSLAAFSIAQWWLMVRRRRVGGETEANDDRLGFWLVASVLLWNYSLVTWILNGLETPLSLALLFFAATFYQRQIIDRRERSMANAALLGLLLGLGVLARIDIALMVPILLVCHLLERHLTQSHLRGAERRSALVSVLIESTLIGGVALAVSAPWWIYNYTTFGSVLPISGQAQQMLNPDRIDNLKATVTTISDAFYLNSHLPIELQDDLWFLGTTLALLVGITLLTRRSTRRSIAASLGAWKEDLRWFRPLPVVLFALALTFFYSFYFGAPHFQFRYLVVVRLLLLLGIVSGLLALYRRKPGWRLPLAALLALYVGTSTVMLLRSFLWTAEQGNTYLAPAEWIAHNVRPGEKVGMFQSGTTGFLLSNVENLDGKVNARALAAAVKGELPRYVDSAAFDYIIDWDMFTRPLLAAPELRDRYLPVDTLQNSFVVWKRSR